MTWQELTEAGAARLRAAGVPEADLDARYLLEEISGLDMPHYLLVRGETISDPEKIAAYEEGIRRRSAGEPLQYIIGHTDFMGHSFRVSPAVLIPRQDTETLCEEALRILQEMPEGAEILDLCTGSGCILLSILLGSSHAHGVGADISADALGIARENAQRLCPRRARFVQSDMFSQIEGRFDLIVSNPPYIPAGDIPGLMREVAGHEPLLALDGGADGLDFYRVLAARAMDHLKPGGCLLMEIGYDQAQAVSGLLAAAGWQQIKVIKDLARHDRVVCARYGFSLK